MAKNGNGNDQREWVLSALDEYEGRLTRYAIRILGDEEAARDAVQHAFLQLCDQDPDELNGRLAPWLYTVCRNKAVDQLRLAGRHESLNGTEAWELSGREPDPAVAAESQDLTSWLRELVDALPAKLREVLDLWLDGFSYREIAEITDRTNGHIRVMIHRAVTKLREHPQIQELLGDQPESKTLSKQST
jgi:RNA polymerase sigma-70 factor (ECF subfamily)